MADNMALLSNENTDLDKLIWNYIPPNALEHVFLNLSINDRLGASSTCRQWRECLFSPCLWRDISMTINSPRDAVKVAFLAQCVKYSYSLTVLWPYQIRSVTRSLREANSKKMECIQTFMTAVADSVNLRTVHLQFNNIWTHHKEFTSHMQHCVNLLLENSSKLEYLSLGCNLSVTDNCFLDNISPESSASLQELHLGHVYFKSQESELEPLHAEFNTPKRPLHDLFSNPMVFTEMKNLKQLSICWGHVTATLLDALNERNTPAPLEKLNIFANSHSCVRDGILVHPDKEQWSLFADNHKKVKVSLIFVGEFDGLCSHMEEIKPGVTTLKFLEYSAVEPDEVGVVMLWHQETLDTLIYCCHWDPVMLENGHEFWPYITQCGKLKHLAFIGHYIPDEVLVLLANQFRGSLETLVVSKSHIISFAEATDFMVPISGGRYNAIKREVSDVLGRPWEAVACNKIPLSGYYFCEGKDNSFFCRNQ